ncbi:MAG: hypothetical protein QOI01_6036 [Mycobacterium sp.]|jgi:hypothetical protein|nr:hypothetical protein [Mycobacterium sp.]
MTLVLDTNEFPVTDRAEVVREAIATTIVPVEIAWPNRTTRVAAQGVIGDLGQLTVCSIRSTAHVVERTARLARDSLEPASFRGRRSRARASWCRATERSCSRPAASWSTTRPPRRLHEVLPRRRHRADGVLAVVLEGHRISDGQSHDRRTHVPPLLFNSYDNAEIAEVGTELDDLLAQLIRRLGSQFTIPTDGT